MIVRSTSRRLPSASRGGRMLRDDVEDTFAVADPVTGRERVPEHDLLALVVHRRGADRTSGG